MIRPMALDTDPASEMVLLAGYRRMTAAEKLERVRQLTQCVQQMALFRLREQHPHASDRELQLRLATLWLAPDVMERVFTAVGPPRASRTRN